MLSWLFLLLAGCAEIIGVFVLKTMIETNRKIFLLYLIVCFSCSFGLLSLAMREISMGVAYAVWTGIGAAGGVLVGIILFHEEKSWAKIFFIFLIISSSVLLKLLG